MHCWLYDPCGLVVISLFLFFISENYILFYFSLVLRCFFLRISTMVLHVGLFNSGYLIGLPDTSILCFPVQMYLEFLPSRCSVLMMTKGTVCRPFF